jgi:hypothetical protein
VSSKRHGAASTLRGRCNSLKPEKLPIETTSAFSDALKSVHAGDASRRCAAHGQDDDDAMVRSERK